MPRQEQLYVAFRKNDPGANPEFYLGEARYNRLKNNPSAEPFQFMTLRAAVLRFYPKTLPAPDNLRPRINRIQARLWGTNGIINL